MAAVADLIGSYRPDGRRLRRLLCQLTERPASLDDLIRESALPRKTVEELLAAADRDLARHRDGAVQIVPARAPGYRERFGCDRLALTELTDPLERRLEQAEALRRTMADLIAGAPAARPDLDHVPATPETAVRRALWLDSTYDLGGAVVLFTGDHDLTSLAVGQVRPDARLIVVDVDERLLEYIDDCAAGLGLDIQCFVSDLRLWLAESAAGCADLAFTDPPYTPEGVMLFTARSLQGMANREHGRVIVAYGYSDRHPSLGFQGQSAAHRLGLAAEAQLPAFSRYVGAQAVGSASDLYVWRPTSRTWRQLDGVLAEIQTNIYTQGGQSLERVAGSAESAWAAAARPIRVQTTDAGFPLRVVVGGDQPGEAPPARLRLHTLLTAGIPSGMTGRDRFAIAVDLTADPGALLLRVLLAANAGRVCALVPSNHHDVRDEAGQQALATLLAAKYSLLFLRGQPDGRHAIVVATAVSPDTVPPGAHVPAWMLRRAHGKIGNVWREGLLSAPRDGGTQLTKRDARAIVERAARRPEILGARIIDVPRSRLTRLLRDAETSASAINQG